MDDVERVESLKVPELRDPVAFVDAVGHRHDDKLLQIWIAQRDSQAERGYNFGYMSTEETIEYIKWNVLALTAELHEALDETQWKPWSKGKAVINRDAFIGELIDALHFLLNLFLGVGAIPSEITSRFMEKNAKNHTRFVTEYNGMDKCAQCRRELDTNAHLAPGSITITNDAGKKFCSYPCRDMWNEEHAA